MGFNEVSDKELRCSAADFKVLREQCATDFLPRLVAMMSAHDADNGQGTDACGLLFSRVDEGPYGLDDWLRGLEILVVCLEQKQRTAKWDMLLGYLACCAESQQGSTVRPPLEGVVAEMLEAYGFDG